MYIFSFLPYHFPMWISVTSPAPFLVMLKRDLTTSKHQLILGNNDQSVMRFEMFSRRVSRRFRSVFGRFWTAFRNSWFPCWFILAGFLFSLLPPLALLFLLYFGFDFFGLGCLFDGFCFVCRFLLIIPWTEKYNCGTCMCDKNSGWRPVSDLGHSTD